MCSLLQCSTPLSDSASQAAASEDRLRSPHVPQVSSWYFPQAEGSCNLRLHFQPGPWTSESALWDHPKPGQPQNPGHWRAKAKPRPPSRVGCGQSPVRSTVTMRRGAAGQQPARVLWPRKLGTGSPGLWLGV